MLQVPRQEHQTDDLLSHYDNGSLPPISGLLKLDNESKVDNESLCNSLTFRIKGLESSPNYLQTSSHRPDFDIDLNRFQAFKTLTGDIGGGSSVRFSNRLETAMGQDRIAQPVNAVRKDDSLLEALNESRQSWHHQRGDIYHNISKTDIDNDFHYLNAGMHHKKNIENTVWESIRGSLLGFWPDKPEMQNMVEDKATVNTNGVRFKGPPAARHRATQEFHNFQSNLKSIDNQDVSQSNAGDASKRRIKYL